jgi:hypothetical protein
LLERVWRTLSVSVRSENATTTPAMMRSGPGTSHRCPTVVKPIRPGTIRAAAIASFCRRMAGCAVGKAGR